MDIKKCLKELTLEEKISLLEGADLGFTNPVRRLGISRILLVDGPHGVRVVKGSNPDGENPYTMTGEMEPATAFPCEAAMASSWNLELLQTAGKQAGEECRKFHVNVLLGPGADGKRSPLGGRNFEYYSEDPYLSGKMAAAFIDGLQSMGIGACLKHYVLNDQETRRMSVDVHVDERTLWEIYLKPFEIAIKEAKPWSIMGSYNKKDGQYLCENRRMLMDILRDKLGFEGAVVSDWSAVKNKVNSIKNGLNIQMPGPSGQIAQVMEAVQRGEITEEEIDARVLPVLGLIEKAVKNQGEVDFDWESHHATAIRLAEEGMVLLQNEERFLPLEKNCRVAVIGELARLPHYTGGGSSSLTPQQLDIPLEEIQKAADVVYADGYQGTESNETLMEEAVLAAKDKEAVLFFAGSMTSEGRDRKDLRLPGCQTELLNRISKVNENIVLITMCGSAVEYGALAISVKSILHAWLPGEGVGTALRRLLFGETCPSGKLTETFPAALSHTPAYMDFPGFKDDVYYNEGILTGYRYYDTRDIAPLYPFGYGMSYTTFAYSNMRLSKESMKNGDTLQVSVDVTNTGEMAGMETVQLYVSDPESYLFRPKKELKGFAKVNLLPQETKTVTITLTEDAFSYYLPHLERFAVESGEFEILLGASVEDIRERRRIWFESSDEVRLPLEGVDLFEEFLLDDRYSEKAAKLLEILQIDEQNVFYQLLMGSAVNQLAGLMCMMGVDEKTAEQMVSQLLCAEN